ncbi:unnamed protein product [Victoria cruziana]
MQDCKPIATPSILNHKFSLKKGTPFHDSTLYRSIVGMLQYLTFTRPDIVYSVNQVSQFIHALADMHMEAVKRILIYLKGTIGDDLTYTRSLDLGYILRTYIDADWAGDPDERRSVSGYCIYMGQNLVSWSSRKQRAIAKSSTEAEYRAMAAGTTEVIWIRHILGESREPVLCSTLLCDNQSAINIAPNPILHSRTKHIEIDQYFVRQKIEDQELSTCYVPSSEQVVDIFAKGLTVQQFWHLKHKLSTILHHAQFEGAVRI